MRSVKEKTKFFYKCIYYEIICDDLGIGNKINRF